MSDHDTTIGPHQARELRRSGSMRSLGENLGRAKIARDDRRTKIIEKWGVTGVHVVDGIRKAVGVVVVGFAGMKFRDAWGALEKMLASRQSVDPNAAYRLVDFYAFAPALFVAAIGWAVMDPVRAQGAAMWVVNNLLDRVPFLRPRAAPPTEGV